MTVEKGGRRLLESICQLWDCELVSFCDQRRIKIFFFFLANSTLNCKHLNGQIFSYLPSLSLKAVVADWALLTPPSLTCPARSSRLLSLPSAAVSRSGKGGGKGKVNRALAQQRDSSTTTTPTISQWHCLRLCCVTFELKCKNRKARDSMRLSLFAC